MSVAIAIPDRLAKLLHTLAIQHGISIEELSEQALTVGLIAFSKNAPADIVDIGSVGVTAQTSSSTVPMRSPIIAHGPIRPLHVVFEPNPEAPTDEN